MLLSPSIHSPPSVVLMEVGIQWHDGITIALVCEKMVFDCSVLKKVVTVFDHWSVRRVSTGWEWTEEALC